jgi:predicted MFS family arabinose efflux permease
VADLWGRRAIYCISAGLMIVLTLVLRRMLPERAPEHTTGYGSLLRSVLVLVRQEPVLRRRALCQATLFGAFSAFWTAIAYELIGEHGFGQAQIAIFALVGAGGAAAAPLGGKLADRGYGVPVMGAALGLGTLAMVLAAAGHRSVILLALAGVLLDFAVQSHQVSSQQEIYALRADARARINTVYMTTVFTGGAISSALTGVLHERYGWTGACVIGAVFPLIGLVIWAYGRRSSASASSAGASAPAGASVGLR